MHCDRDALSLRALGEPVALDEAHLAECGACADELSRLRAAAQATRAGAPSDADIEAMTLQPPEQVWQAIAAATGVRPETLTLDAPRPAPPGSARHAAAPAAAAPALSAPRERVPARRWPGWALAASLVLGVVLGGFGWQILGSGSTGSQPPPVAAPTTVGTVALEPLGPTTTSSGQARMLQRDGHLSLALDAAGLAPEPDAYYEVWLLTPDASRMIPLGALAADHEEFPVPDGVDLAAFSVVDVSVEPYDGDPQHSGDSVLRGVMA